LKRINIANNNKDYNKYKSKETEMSRFLRKFEKDRKFLIFDISYVKLETIKEMMM